MAYTTRMGYLLVLFTQASLQLDLPPGLLQSVCYVESNHKVSAMHYNDGVGNSVGICQIKLKTAKWMGFKGNEEELMQPDKNIYYAGKYLQYQIKRYKAIKRGVIAYNYGHAKQLTSTYYQEKVYNVWKNNPAYGQPATQRISSISRVPTLLSSRPGWSIANLEAR